jgi:hypothetical protein
MASRPCRDLYIAKKHRNNNKIKVQNGETLTKLNIGIYSKFGQHYRYDITKYDFFHIIQFLIPIWSWILNLDLLGWEPFAIGPLVPIFFCYMTVLHNCSFTNENLNSSDHLFTRFNSVPWKKQVIHHATFQN